MKKLLIGVVFSVLVFKLNAACSPTPDDMLKYWAKTYQTPQDYIVGKFSKYKWVVLGEYHRQKQDVDLVNALIPLLHEKTDVRCLAIEFLRGKDTEEANQLVTAKEFDRDKAIEILKRQEVDWAYEEYLQLYRTVWESNQKFASKRGAFKLVGFDPPYDSETENWGTDPEAVEAAKELPYKADRIMADYLEELVLKKSLKALIYCGKSHAVGKFYQYRTDKNGKYGKHLRMGNYIYKKPYEKDIFFINLHSVEFSEITEEQFYVFDGKLDKLMKRFRKDIGFDIAGSPLEGIKYSDPKKFSMAAYSLGDLYDGYVMFKTPIKETAGLTCVKDWIKNDAQYYGFWRHVANKTAAERYSKIPYGEFMKFWCAEGDLDYGASFKERFSSLPDISD